MRLFVAVELGSPMRMTAATVARDLRSRLRNAPDVKWVQPENMHLTVRFIGHIDDARVPQVLEVLAPPLEIHAFDIAFGDCGVFPAHGRPRVLWIGLREGLASLQSMHDEFNRRLAPLGFEPENRPFNAHLTLARIKDAPGGLGARVHQAMRDVRVAPARSHVVEATVFESRLSPNGASYVARVRIALQEP